MAGTLETFYWAGGIIGTVVLVANYMRKPADDTPTGEFRKLLKYTEKELEDVKQFNEMVKGDLQSRDVLLAKNKEEFESYILKHPDPDDLVKEARRLNQDEKYDEAEEEYAEAMEPEQNQTAQHYFERGLNLVAALKFEAALKLMFKAAVVDEENIEILAGYATLLENLGQYEPAEKVFRRAIALTEEEEVKQPLYNNLGLCLDNQGKLREARDWYQKSIELAEKLYQGSHPEKATSYNNLGTLEQAVGDFSEARKWILKALEMREELYVKPHPEKATSYNNLGSLEKTVGNYAEAHKWYLKDREIMEELYNGPHPEKAISYNNLSMLELQLGNFAEAWKWSLKSALMLEENWPSTPNAIQVRKNLELLHQIWTKAGGNPPPLPPKP